MFFNQLYQELEVVFSVLVTDPPEDRVEADGVTVVITDCSGTVATPQLGRGGAVSTLVPGTDPGSGRPGAPAQTGGVVGLRTPA